VLQVQQKPKEGILLRMESATSCIQRTPSPSPPKCYNPPQFSLPFLKLPPSHILPPTIIVDQTPPSVLPTLEIPMPPIPWDQHIPIPEPVQDLQDSDMSSPSPEPVQELQDSDMTSPSLVISQLPEQLEPLPSPRYIVTEPFTPYQRTSPPECRHNTHELP